MSSCGYVRREDADERTVRWTNSLRSVAQLLACIEAEPSYDGWKSPGRQGCPEDDWVEPHEAWLERIRETERRGPIDSVVRALDLRAISWSPSAPIMCQRVLEWAHAALTRLQEAYAEIDTLKAQRKAQADTIEELRKTLATERQRAAARHDALVEELNEAITEAEDLQLQLADEHAHRLRLGDALASERRVTTGLQIALSTVHTSSAILAKAAGVSEKDRRRALKDAQTLLEEINR